MRRKATILDVLRDAQDGGTESQPGGSRASAVPKAGPDKPRRAKRRGAKESRKAAEWLRQPTHLTHLGALCCAVAVVAGIWVAFQLGVTKGHNRALASQNSHRKQVAGAVAPGRMRGESSSAGAARTAGEEKGFDRPEPPGREPAEGSRASEGPQPLGFRIVTYADTAKNREMAALMRQHLAMHLKGTGAEDQWMLHGGKLIVAVGFPANRRGDTRWQDRLFDRIRRLPPPDPSLIRFDFSRLEKHVIVGRLR